MDDSGLRTGHRIGPQLLGRRGSRMVVDASHVPTKVDKGTGLVLFPIDGVFTDPRTVFLGFGKPNTYLVVPRAADDPKGVGWNKFAAFLFWRKPSFVADTKGRVQAGVLFEFRGLSAEAIASLSEPLRPFPGKLNRVTKLKKYVLFSKPMVYLIRSHIMAEVDYYDGQPARKVIDMLQPSESPDVETAFKYNLVLTGTQVFLTRLENRNGRDWQKINWILAKHVLISGYDPDVRFSGEVWRHSNEHGVTTLYLNGDSGTYKPDDARLEPAVQYAASTFGLPVEAVRTR